MKSISVALLGSSSSIHMQRWANGLASRGVVVHLISMDSSFIEMDQKIHFYQLPIKSPLGYMANIFALKKILSKVKPDLMNVHYATGYGLLARLTSFHPTLLSVWGSDVFIFPYKTKLHHYIISGNLSFPDELASTSKVMAHATNKLLKTTKNIHITPFGIDCQKFSLSLQEKKENIVIGTVKALDPKYGVDLLIQSFSQLKKRLETSSPDIASKLKLMIVGDGPDLFKLQALVASLHLEENTEFVGKVSHEEVPLWLNKLDIYVALSRSESFGVAILEASACGIPVIVSDVGGLPEVVNHGETGFIIPNHDIEKVVVALIRLATNADLRKSMGSSGHAWVKDNYSWEQSLDIMTSAYRSLVSKRRAC